MSYKGLYQIQNREKLIGKIEDLNYRSLWERQVMGWCDQSPSVKKWGFEVVIIPYPHPIEHRMARYIVDFLIVYDNDEEVLVEIKPKKETTEPVYPGKRSTRYQNAMKKWAVNSAKWEQATILAESNGGKFQVWDEDVLGEMGILHPGVSGAGLKAHIYAESRQRKIAINKRRVERPKSATTPKVPTSATRKRKAWPNNNKKA